MKRGKGQAIFLLQKLCYKPGRWKLPGPGFYHPDGERNELIEFGNYVISVIDMDWNGVFVTLEIRGK